MEEMRIEAQIFECGSAEDCDKPCLLISRIDEPDGYVLPDTCPFNDIEEVNWKPIGKASKIVIGVE